MKFPILGNLIQPSPFIKVTKTQMEYIQNQIVELGRLRDIRDNLQNEIWPPAIWKLVSMADTFVLGRDGIKPQFNNPAATQAWRRYLVDSRQRLTVRKLLRMVLASLIVHNEAFMVMQVGTLTPMPPPSSIQYGENNTIPISYTWANPRPVTYAAEEVWHLMVEWYPAQKRGNSILWVLYDLLNDRRNYIRSLVKMAKNAARLAIVHKRNRANPLIDPEISKDDLKDTEQEFNFDEDNFLRIGPNDSFESLSVSPSPHPPSEIDRLVMGTVGQRAGLSRMAVSGDFSEATYSSGRFADLNDRGVYERHQDVLLEVVEYLYDQWPERGFYATSFKGFYLPPHPYIDPGRTASVNSQLVNMKAKSVQQVIREEGADPEEVFAEIKEFERRFPELARPPSGGFPPSGGQGTPATPTSTGALNAYFDDS